MFRPPYLGYVSMPFGIKGGTNFEKLFQKQILQAPFTATVNPAVVLFREDATRPPWKPRHKTRIDWFRGGRRTHEFQLRESIQENIAGSDFVVAVLTNFNPNVMLEVGFAQARKKHIIYLLDRDQFKDMPSNLLNLKRLHLYRLSENLCANLHNRMTEVIDDIKQQRMEVQDQSDVALEYFGDRNSVGLSARLRSASQIIQILTTNLTTVSANLIDAIVWAVKDHPDLRVRILTSDPSNIFIKPRANQLIENEAGYQMELVGSLASVRAKLQPYKNCEVRTYKDFPVQLWHRIDGHIYIGQSSLVRRTRYNSVFGVSVETENIKETFLDHFDKLWTDVSPGTKKKR